MTTATGAIEGLAEQPQTAVLPPAGLSRLGWVVADTLTVAKRNLIAYTRIPQSLFFSSVQPVMFVLLFRYVFGGAIHVPGRISYVDFLMPGIFVQTVAFGAVATSIGLAEDLQKGLIERFRALPMSRFAVLAGRTVADLVRNVVVAAIITLVGFGVGFRFVSGGIPFLGGVAVLLAFSYAMGWGFAFLGLSAPNSETAQVMSFPVLFPLIFASPAFVPVQSMPGWLQAFAKHQPLGILVQATRALMTGGPTATYAWEALAWTAGLLVVLAPLAVWRFSRTG